MHEWGGMGQLQQAPRVQYKGRVYETIVLGFGRTIEDAFITGQIHFRALLDERSVPWREFDPGPPKMPTQEEFDAITEGNDGGDG